MGTTSRFVIQKHTREGRSVHWDLMLESGSSLETYRLEIPPGELGPEPTGATKIFDHPARFLTYEGSVNEGRGSVRIEESGTYTLLQSDDSGRTIELEGTLVSGKLKFALIRGEKWEVSLSS